RLRQRVRRLRAQAPRVALDEADLQRVVERLGVGDALEDRREVRVPPPELGLVHLLAVDDAFWREVRIPEAEEVLAVGPDIADKHVPVPRERLLNAEVVLRDERVLQIE